MSRNERAHRGIALLRRLRNRTQSGQFLTEGATYIAIDVVQHVAALATIPAVFLSLSAAQLGVITSALVVSNFASLSNVGLDFAVIRQYYQFGEDQRSEIVGVAVKGTLAVSAIVAFGSACLFLYAGAAILPWTLGIMTGALSAARAVPFALFRVRGELGRYAALMIGTAWLQAIAQIASLMLGLGVLGFLGAAAAMAALSTGASYIGLRSQMRTDLPWSRIFHHQTVTYALNVFPSVCLNRLLIFADRLALMAWSDFDSLGLYGAATRFSTPMKLVSSGLKMALAPAISRQENPAETAPRATMSAMTFAMVSTTLALGVLVLMFGHVAALTPWKDHVPQLLQILTLLIAAQILGGVAALLQVQVLFSSRPGAATITTAAQGIALAGALVTLVPAAQELGAAFAELFAAVVGVIVTALTVSRVARRSAGPVSLWVLIGSFAPAAIAPWVMPPSGQLTLWAVLLLAYLGVLGRTLAHEFHGPSVSA